MIILSSDMKIQVKRVLREDIIKYTITDKTVRDGWCTTNKPCPKYNKRPCCPPNIPLFSEFKHRKYLYLISAQMLFSDYYKKYPKVYKSKSVKFLTMGGTHKKTRNLVNKVAKSFNGLAFTVGGCIGCDYIKYGKCPRLCPALEATGINVVKLSKELLNTDIEWSYPNKSMCSMVAVGGIYTDEDIKPNIFKEVIQKCVKV